MRCCNFDCPKRSFAEQFSELIPKHAQRTKRLSCSLEQLGLALSANQTARLASTLKMPVSQDTVLRIIKAIKLQNWSTPKILGIDDFAFAKGQRYGTLLVDLEKHQPIELLPDRTAPTLEKWLSGHKEVQIVCRDRSTEYTRAINRALPTATQVADRWHILKNLRQSLYRVINRCYPALVAKTKTNSNFATQFNLDPTSVDLKLGQYRGNAEKAASEVSLEKKTLNYQQVKEAAQAGKSQRQIARDLHLNRETVRQYLARNSEPKRATRTSRHPSKLAPYYVYLEQRWQAGCTNTMQLWREVQAQGYIGSRYMVHCWVHLRRQMPVTLATTTQTQPEFRLPGVKGLTWLMLRRPQKLSLTDQAVLKLIKEDTTLEQSWKLIQSFCQSLRERDNTLFRTWLNECLASGVGELVTFAQGLLHDQAAIEAGVCGYLSNGQTEGQVNKLKVIKRQLYGRGSFELLRRKVLLAA